MADLEVWRAGSAYSPEETAVRLHHRIVWIHPFENGNGRHARLLADLYLFRAGCPPLDWGRTRGSLMTTGELRREYIDALRAADAGRFGPLLAFVYGEAELSGS